MGHAEVDNRTPFAFEALFLADERGRPLFVGVVKATFRIAQRALRLAETQRPPSLTGEHWGVPGASSYRYEPEMAFEKLATDVVLLGHACAPRAGTRQMTVTLKVGPVAKTVLAHGERVWTRARGRVEASEPQSFERIPLRWEHAFGGADPSLGDSALEPRNPVGIGYRADPQRFEEGAPLPQLEDPSEPLTHYGAAPAPAGFGFVGPSWQPRARFAGSYDAAWLRERAPLLPLDFDRRFFNAAAAGLIAPGHLDGDEAVEVHGARADGSLGFALPGVAPPTLRLRRARAADAALATRLDTVVIDADELEVLLTWRAHLELERGPHDLRAIAIEP